MRSEREDAIVLCLALPIITLLGNTEVLILLFTAPVFSVIQAEHRSAAKTSVCGIQHYHGPHLCIHRCLFGYTNKRISRYSIVIILEHTVCRPDYHTRKEAIGVQTWLLSAVEMADISVFEVEVCPQMFDSINCVHSIIFLQIEIAVVGVSIRLVSRQSRVKRAH